MIVPSKSIIMAVAVMVIAVAALDTEIVIVWSFVIGMEFAGKPCSTDF